MALSLFLIALAAPAAARPLDDLLWDLQLVPLDGPAPPLALPALDGPPVALAGLRGRAVLVYFWHST